MVKKGKAKKVKKGKNAIVEEKKKELQKHWEFFLVQCGEYTARLNSICSSTCNNIHKMYADKLKSLPENIRNMTLTEYVEMQQNVANMEAEKNEILRSQFEKTKLMSEKKKTLKKNRIEKKRSNSVVSNMSRISTMSCMPSYPNPLLSRESRVLSDSCLATPLSKQSVIPTFSVTPKFNPRAPIMQSHLRRPRVGEILMSLSGSPLQNFVDEIPDKPGVAVSLGGGKIIKITEDTEIAKLENDFDSQVDDETKIKLENIKRKLDSIFPS